MVAAQASATNRMNGLRMMGSERGIERIVTWAVV
jgi:hypothetical protein